MRKNPAKIVWIIFACIGIAFVILGFVIGNAMKIPEEDQVETTAIITEINRRRDSDGDTTYDVWVEYEVKGEKYERELSSYVSSYRVGKEIEVIYDRNDPGRVQTKNEEKIFTWIFSGIGGVFAVLGIGGLLAGVFGKNKREKLRQTGTMIYAKYDGVDVNTALQVNGQSPFNIVCSWLNPEDNKTYIFRSENLYYNPQSIIESMGITTFPVYIDMENKKNYTIDISMIEEKIVDLR